MTRRHLLSGTLLPLLLATLFLPGSGCSGEAPSTAEVVLPAGDPAAGQVAFVELQCNGCHSVSGVDMALPVADPPVGVDLGVVSRRRTRGELVTAIIHPDHELSTRFASGVMERRGHSRMGDYSDVLTVRQLADIVAFLDSPGQNRGD